MTELILMASLQTPTSIVPAEQSPEAVQLLLMSMIMFAGLFALIAVIITFMVIGKRRKKNKLLESRKEDSSLGSRGIRNPADSSDPAIEFEEYDFADQLPINHVIRDRDYINEGSAL